MWLFGTELEAELRAARDGAKNSRQAALHQQRVMSQYLGTKMQFRDPAGMSTKADKPAASTTAVTSEATGPVKL